MGLEKEKKEAQETKIKEEGEEKLSKEEIRKDVLEVIAEEREKTAATQNLGSIRKQVDHLEGEIGEVKKLLCAPGGGPCFATQEQLDTFLKAHDKKIEDVDAKLATVVERISNLKPPKAEGPEGLKPLAPMTDEKRKGSTEEENRLRDGEVDGIVKWSGITDNDMYRRISRDPNNTRNIAKKPNIRGEVFDSATDEEIRGAMLIGCRDGKCKVLRSKLEAEEGLKIYQKNDRGDFEPVDQPEKKSLIF